MALFGTLNGILGAGGAAPSRWIGTADGIQVLTEDFGVTWSGDKNYVVGQSAVHGMPSGTWLISENDVAGRGIYQSTDNGDSFTFRNNFNSIGVRGFSADNSKNWVAVGESSTIKYSSDDGVTWATASNPFGLSTVRIQAVTNNGSGDYICAGHTYNPGGGEVVPIAVSNDSGVTWTTVEFSSSNDINTMSTDGSIWLAAGRNGTLYRSTNTGTSWTEITNPFDGKIEGVANFGGTWIMVGSDSGIGDTVGISRSTDGGLTWGSFISNPLAAGDVRIKYDALGQLLIYNKQGASKGSSTSTDDGLTWSSVVNTGVNGSVNVGLSVFSNNSGNT